jgi:hypothetical protein
LTGSSPAPGTPGCAARPPTRRPAAGRAAPSDEITGGNEATRRLNRAQIVYGLAKRLPKGERAKQLVPLIVRGHTPQHRDACATDLTKARLDELVAAEDDIKALDGHGKIDKWHANQTLQAHIRNLLDDQELMAGGKDTVKAFEAAKYLVRRQNLTDRMQVEMGHLNETQAVKSKLFDYAFTHMGGGYEEGVGLVDEHGEPLPVEAIDAHMKANGIPEGVEAIGFATDRPGVLGARAHFRGNSRPVYEGRFTRTGEAHRLGTNDVSLESLADSMVRGQGIIDAMSQRRRLIDTFVAGDPKTGGWFTSADQAAKFARDAATRGQDLVVYQVTDARLDRARQQAQQDHFQPDNNDAIQHEHDLEFAPSQGATVDIHADMAGHPPGDYGVMSRTAYNRMKDHENAVSNVLRPVQEFTQKWRNTVLYSTSMPKWVAGNLAELAIRLAIAGAGPRSLIVGWKVMAATAQQAGHVQEASYIYNLLAGGAHFSGTAMRQINFAMRDNQGALEQAIHDFGHKPGATQMVHTWELWKAGIAKVNRLAEHGGAYAAIGKLTLKDREAWHHLNNGWKDAMTIGPQAAGQVARGLLNTSEQIRYARFVYDTIGRYTNLSPKARQIVANYTPFGLWYANAVKFCIVTIPRNHPLFTSLLAASYAASEQDRLQRHQSLWDDSALPGFLQGSLFFKGYGPDNSPHQFSRYTPFGAFDDLPAIAKGQILPQISNFTAGLAGTDFKGAQMSRSDGHTINDADRLKYALYVTFEGMIPFMSATHKVVEGAGKPYMDDYLWHIRTKPGTRESRTDALKSLLEPGRGYKQKQGGATKPPSLSGGIPGIPSSQTIGGGIP